MVTITRVDILALQRKLSEMPATVERRSAHQRGTVEKQIGLSHSEEPSLFSLWNDWVYETFCDRKIH